MVVVDRLEHDHRDAAAHHAVVDTLMRQWLASGALDGERSTTLRASLEALRSIYTAHIAVEDGQLFPAAKRLLSDEDLHDIGQEMAARRSRRTA
jgi:hemerythrin-like domain-containing protein